MDLKLFLATFGLVFLAELGDKTQLATMLLAAKSHRPLAVFLAAALALVVSALLGALLGEAAAHLLPMRLIRAGAGIAFLALGVLLLMGRL
jgi:putative Ca2+/H+ antiporter (TMEM165/GDT1 family)